MLTEVNLSPKPGLVDRINCGAHKRYGAGRFPPQRAGDSGLVTPFH
ncbi:triphosphoribosyl-dephospho-CoA synthase [Escherichia coli]